MIASKRCLDIHSTAARSCFAMTFSARQEGRKEKGEESTSAAVLTLRACENRINLPSPILLGSASAKGHPTSCGVLSFTWLDLASSLVRLSFDTFDTFFHITFNPGFVVDY